MPLFSINITKSIHTGSTGSDGGDQPSSIFAIVWLRVQKRMKGEEMSKSSQIIIRTMDEISSIG
jgi:hypothetical protein